MLRRSCAATRSVPNGPKFTCYTGERQLLSATELCKQCRLLVPFLFGEANPNPNLKPTWLAIIAGRARPDEPEVVGGVQEEGW